MDAINRVTGAIVDAAIRIHTRLGPGLLESVYKAVLARDLQRRGLHVEREKQISFEFEGMHFENACRADLVVGRSVVIEVKSAAKLAPVHARQLLTYLRLLDLRVGLLLNFGENHLRDGIKRIKNGS